MFAPFSLAFLLAIIRSNESLLSCSFQTLQIGFENIGLLVNNTAFLKNTS